MKTIVMMTRVITGARSPSPMLLLSWMMVVGTQLADVWNLIALYLSIKVRHTVAHDRWREEWYPPRLNKLTSVMTRMLEATQLYERAPGRVGGIN